MVPMRNFSALGDDLRKAVDYFKVAEYLQRTAAAGSRRLLETLAWR